MNISVVRRNTMLLAKIKKPTHWMDCLFISLQLSLEHRNSITKLRVLHPQLEHTERILTDNTGVTWMRNNFQRKIWKNMFETLSKESYILNADKIKYIQLVTLREKMTTSVSIIV